MRKIRFWVKKREYNKSYALFCEIDSTGGWNLNDWDHKPTDKEVEFATMVALRAMEVYHRHVMSVRPSFDLEIQD